MSDLPPLPPMPAADREHLTDRVLGALDSAFPGVVQGVMLHGAALRGDFVTDGLTEPRTPDLEHALALPRALAAIDATPFAVAHIQPYTVRAHATRSVGFRRSQGPARSSMGRRRTGCASRMPRRSRRRPVHPASGHGQTPTAIWGGLRTPWPPVWREGCVASRGSLKPLAYNAAILLGADPLRARTLPLGEVLPPSPALLAAFREIRRWGEVRGDPERLRALFRLAHTAVGEVCALAGA